MAKFQPGQRAYLKWCPDQECEEKAQHARCQIVTIVDGPGLPGNNPMAALFDMVLKGRNRNYWKVELDNGQIVVAWEELLEPLDDDSGRLIEHDANKESNTDEAPHNRALDHADG